MKTLAVYLVLERVDYTSFSLRSQIESVALLQGHLVLIVKPENTCTLYKTQNLTSLARFPNLATLESVNLIVGFTITI